MFSSFDFLRISKEWDFVKVRLLGHIVALFLAF